MAPFRPKSASGASCSHVQLPGAAGPARPRTSLLRRSSTSEGGLGTTTAPEGRARAGSALKRSESAAQFRRQRSAAERRLMASLSEECPGWSESVRFPPRHHIHDRRFYRSNQENIWNNIWRVPKSRLKYLTPFAKNQDAIDSIEARFHEQNGEDEDEERQRRERHDQILSQFRVQRLRNLKRDLRCQYPKTCLAGRRPLLPIPTNEASSRDEIWERLARPRPRRNRPECSSTDMAEYRGLILGHDIRYFYTDQYEAGNAALAYAHDLYRDMLPHPNKAEGERDGAGTTATAPRGVRLLRHHSSKSVGQIADETRRELSEFETRISIARRC